MTGLLSPHFDSHRPKEKRPDASKRFTVKEKALHVLYTMAGALSSAGCLVFRQILPRGTRKIFHPRQRPFSRAGSRPHRTCRALRAGRNPPERVVFEAAAMMIQRHDPFPAAQHGVSVRRTAAVGAYLAGGGDGVAIELAAHGRGPPFSREELSCGTAAVSSIVGHPSV